MSPFYCQSVNISYSSANFLCVSVVIYFLCVYILACVYCFFGKLKRMSS